MDVFTVVLVGTCRAPRVIGVCSTKKKALGMAAAQVQKCTHRIMPSDVLVLKSTLDSFVENPRCNACKQSPTKI